MTDFNSTFALSTSGMQAQADRLRTLSENIANADTPGYRRKVVPFESVLRSGEVAAGRVTLDRTELPQVYDPSHPMADDRGNYEGSNVNMVIEIADAREAQRGYEANLKLFDQARQMSQGLLELLRR